MKNGIKAYLAVSRLMVLKFSEAFIGSLTRSLKMSQGRPKFQLSHKAVNESHVRTMSQDEINRSGFIQPYYYY